VGADRYITLMTSLPFPGDLFGARQTPLSRIRLEQRLRQLAPEDAALLRRIEDLLQWSHQPLARGDREILARARALMEDLENPLLQALVTYRLEERTLLAGLRRRRRGEPAPDARADWGFGRWVGRMRQHWSEPGFRLERVFPWVLEAHGLLEAGDSLGLERLVMGAAWERLGRLGGGHYFDFEAVVIYVLRWDIIDRWTSYSGPAAARRFERLVEQGLVGAGLPA
jgi:hypothetical protein